MKPILILSSLVLLASSCTKEETPSAAETAAKPYPLDVCLVSGEKLGSMGEPVVMMHEGQEIKFCCDSCVPKFQKDPGNYLPKLQKP